MSATISARVQAWGTRDTAILKGVCARIAERGGVPVWMPRVAFVIFGVLHWILAIVAYFVLTRMLCSGRGTAPFVQMPAGPPPSAVRDRFSALDARIAAMEASTLQQETTLRRAFRDLERS